MAPRPAAGPLADRHRIGYTPRAQGGPLIERRATYFSIDIECSGTVPALYDMLSLGAVVVGPGPDQHLQIGASIYLELRPEAPRVDPGAMKVNGLDLDHLRAHGLPLRDGLLQLSVWVKEHTAPGTKPVFVGHNAPFDWSFVAYSYHAHDLPNPFGYKALDTKALATGRLGIHWFDSGKERLDAMLGIASEDLSQKHNALYDARYQADILLKLLER